MVPSGTRWHLSLEKVDLRHVGIYSLDKSRSESHRVWPGRVFLDFLTLRVSKELLSRDRGTGQDRHSIGDGWSDDVWSHPPDKIWA